MSVIDKTQSAGAAASWESQQQLLDPNIPSWKRELIMKKRAAVRGCSAAAATAENAGGCVGSNSVPSMKPINLGTDALKGAAAAAGCLREKSWLGNNNNNHQQQQHQAAVHPVGRESNNVTGLHASGGAHKDWNDDAKVGVGRSLVEPAAANSGNEKRRCVVARLGAAADKAPSAWQSANEISDGEEGWRKFCGKPDHHHHSSSSGRMGEEKGEPAGKADAAAGSCSCSDPGPRAAPSPTCSSYSDGFSFCDGEGRSNGEEFEYGPGIVDRLRTKFISLTVNEREHCRLSAVAPRPAMRRVASLEHLLENSRLDGMMDREGRNKYAGFNGKAGLTNKTRKLDVLKKARSMETLTALDGGGLGHRKSSFDERAKANLLFNDNLVIVEQPKHNYAAYDAGGPVIVRRDLVKRAGSIGIEDAELPKPDIVRMYKKMFEGSVSKDAQKGKTRVGGKSAVAAKIAAQKNVVAKSDTSFSVSNRSSSAKSWLEEAAASGLLKKQTADAKPPSASDNNQQNTATVAPTGHLNNKLSSSYTKSDLNAKEDDAKTTKGYQEKVHEQSKKENIFISPAKPGTKATSNQTLPVNNADHHNDTDNEDTKGVTNRPRIIEVKAKPDEKPVGMIKPLPVSAPLEQKENLINQVKTAMAKSNSIINGTFEDSNSVENVVAPSFKKKGTKQQQQQQQQDTNSVVFNFTGKSNITPNITNTQSSFSIQRPLVKIDNNTGKLVSNLFRGSDVSGIVLLPGMTTSVSSDFSDEDDFVDGPGDCSIPCGVVFEGENVIIGRSCFLQKRDKQLTITFDDGATSTYEYPSESLLLEELMINHDEGDEDLVENKTSSVLENNVTDSTHEVELDASTASSLKNNPALSSSGGLANYIPSKSSGSEIFKLGISRPASMDPLLPIASPVDPSSASPVDDMMIKPADDDQASSWSTSHEAETDLLF